METTLHIVVWRHAGERWQEKCSGTFSDRRLAENFVECMRATGFSGEVGIVSGAVVSVETEEEATARLGKF